MNQNQATMLQYFMWVMKTFIQKPVGIDVYPNPVSFISGSVLKVEVKMQKIALHSGNL